MRYLAILLLLFMGCATSKAGVYNCYKLTGPVPFDAMDRQDAQEQVAKLQRQSNEAFFNSGNHFYRCVKFESKENWGDE